MENFSSFDFTSEIFIGLHVVVEIHGKCYVFNPLQVMTLERKVIHNNKVEFKFKPKLNMQDFLALFHNETYPSRIFVQSLVSVPGIKSVWKVDYFRKGKFDANAAMKISYKKFSNSKYAKYLPEKKISELTAMLDHTPNCDVNLYAENFFAKLRQSDSKPTITQLYSSQRAMKKYIFGEENQTTQPEIPKDLLVNILGESLFKGKKMLNFFLFFH
jgi:hypothetical protein